MSNVPMRARDAWVRALSMWGITTPHVSAIWEVDFVIFLSWSDTGVGRKREFLKKRYSE